MKWCREIGRASCRESVCRYNRPNYLLLKGMYLYLAYAVAQSPGREAALAWASLAQRSPASSVLAREGAGCGSVGEAGEYTLLS